MGRSAQIGRPAESSPGAEIRIYDWFRRSRIPLPALRRDVATIFKRLGLAGSGVEITLAGDAFVRGENRRHMGKNSTTDVLSFPALPPQRDRKAHRNRFLGDVLVSVPRARRQALRQGIPLEREILFLVLHSILHLVGHDHGTEPERLVMQERESRIWRGLWRQVS